MRIMFVALAALGVALIGNGAAADNGLTSRVRPDQFQKKPPTDPLKCRLRGRSCLQWGFCVVATDRITGRTRYERCCKLWVCAR